MGIQAQSGGRKRAAWSMALMVIVFMTSACGQTSTSSEENADDVPPVNASEENAPAENQGEDQADDQGDDQDNQADDQDDAGSDDQADDQGDDNS